MGLSVDEVHLHEVLAWVEEQAKFLPSASPRLVLWFLASNAWRHSRNDKDALPGDVLPRSANLAAIQRGTALSKSSVQRALDTLQDHGYLVSNLAPGNGKSGITLFWSEAADQRRDDFREGIRDLPKGFHRTPKLAVVERPLATVLQFPKVSE